MSTTTRPRVCPAPPLSAPMRAGLPTGSSPLAMYRQLIKMHKAGEVSFANVVTFK